MRPPIERFQLASAAVETVVEPVPIPASTEWSVVQPSAPIVRLPGLQRWVDQHGLISLGGFRYRVPIVLAGEPVEAVAADHLVQIFHREVLIADTCKSLSSPLCKAGGFGNSWGLIRSR
jgi:Mu transposase, C-terminal domain